MQMNNTTFPDLGFYAGMPVPKEIWNYCMKHEEYRGRLLTSELCREIAEILDGQDKKIGGVLNGNADARRIYTDHNER